MHNNIPRNSFGTLCYVLCCFSHVQLFETPWTVACQAPLPMGFSRQEFWSGLPFPSPDDLPYLGIRTQVSCTGLWIPYHWATREALVQFSHSVVSDSLWPHESQHARPPSPSPTPGVHSDSRPSSQWCHPAISSSVVPFPPAPNPSQHQSLFQWVNSSHEVAKVLDFQL